MYFEFALTWVGGYQYVIPTYFDSDMSNSANKVLCLDQKTVIYIYVCGQCLTFNLCSEIRADDKTATYTLTTGKSVTCTFRTGKSVVLMDHP